MEIQSVLQSYPMGSSGDHTLAETEVWKGIERGINPTPTPPPGKIKAEAVLTLFSHSAFSTSGKLTWRGEGRDGDEHT